MSRHDDFWRVRLSALLISTSLAACDSPDPQDQDPQRGEWVDRGKADGAELPSCEDACGEQSLAGCWCDDLCEFYGDCCPDVVEVCECEPITCDDVLDGCGWVEDGCGGNLDCGSCPAATCVPSSDSDDPPLQTITAVGTMTNQEDNEDVVSVVLALAGSGAVACLEEEECFAPVSGELSTQTGQRLFEITPDTSGDRRGVLSKYLYDDGRLDLLARSEGGQCPGPQLVLSAQAGSTAFAGMYSWYSPFHGSCRWHRYEVDLELDGPVCLPLVD